MQLTQKSLEVIDLAKNNGVVMLCFPPHCTHRLQPLDVSFMKPLSTLYSDEIRKWLRSHPGCVVTFSQIAKLASSAFIRAATMPTAINGFRTTGIWPVDPSVFSKVDFVSASTTDLREADGNNEDNFLIGQRNKLVDIRPENVDDVPGQLVDIRQENVDDVPGPSYQYEYLDLPSSISSSAQEKDEENNNTSFTNVAIVEIMPIPKAPTKTRSKRKRGKTVVLTSSPYMKDLKENSMPVKKVVFKEQTAKKVLKFAKKKKLEKSKPNIVTDTACFFCDDLYSASNEGWICCCSCKQ